MIWSKVFGAAAGWTIAGLEGFVVGLLLGELGDRLAAGRMGTGVPLRWLRGRRRDELLPFVIALAAKLARSGGSVGDAECRVIARQLQLSPEELKRHHSLVECAALAPERFHQHLARIVRCVGDDPPLAERIGQALRAIAYSGDLDEHQKYILFEIERQLGLEPHGLELPSDEYEQARRVLGVGNQASPEQIRHAWRQAVRECHPDRRPGDEAAKQRASALNAARDRLLNGPMRKGMNAR